MSDPQQLREKIARTLWMLDYPYQDRAGVDSLPYEAIPESYRRRAEGLAVLVSAELADAWREGWQQRLYCDYPELWPNASSVNPYLGGSDDHA